MLLQQLTTDVVNVAVSGFVEYVIFSDEADAVVESVRVVKDGPQWFVWAK